MSSAPAPPAGSLLAKRRGAAEARRRADDRVRERTEARRRDGPNAALYGPARRQSLEGPPLTGHEVVVASKERPRHVPTIPTIDRYALEVWLRNNGLERSDVHSIWTRMTITTNSMWPS